MLTPQRYTASQSVNNGLQARALSGKESSKKSSRLVEPEEIQAGKTFEELLETDITSSEELRDASLSVALRCDEEGPRGRYVVAMRKLQKGALLFQVRLNLPVPKT